MVRVGDDLLTVKSRHETACDRSIAGHTADGFGAEVALNHPRGVGPLMLVLREGAPAPARRGGTMKKGRTGAGSGRTVRDPAEIPAVGLPMAPTRFPSVASCVNSSVASECLHTQCRYHLKHRGHSEHRLHPTRDCSLTFANEGAHTLDEIAEAFGVSVERIRQIEERALGKLRGSRALRRSHDDSE